MIFGCSSCGYSKEVPDKYAGKTVKCPRCKAAVKIGVEKQAEPVIKTDEERRPQIARYSISEFVNKTAQKDRGQGLFELESERLARDQS